MLPMMQVDRVRTFGDAVCNEGNVFLNKRKKEKDSSFIYKYNNTYNINYYIIINLKVKNN